MTTTSKITLNSGKNKYPIIFFGSEEFSLYALQMLVESGVRVAAVVTKPDTRRGRGHLLTKPAVKRYAESQHIPVWQPASLTDLLPEIEALHPVMGVLVSYGRIIPKALLNAFTPGIINLHPSLLPTYRGPSPIESTILNRDNKTGVTIMQLSPSMDAGPIYAQFPYALDGTETRPELYQTLGQLGAQMLSTMLPDIMSGTLSPTKQDDSKATYCPLLTKQDAYLDLSRLTPGEAEACVRAYLDFPRSRVKVGPYDIIVLKARAVMTKETPLDLECSNGAFLSVELLVAPSGRTMNAQDFLRGHAL